MKRRNLLIASATGITAIASGAIVLTTVFSPTKLKGKPPILLSPNKGETPKDQWIYRKLDRKKTGETAYGLYKDGSCMYATFGSIIKQLAQQYGEPYASFPYAMMKYGSSGIGGFGSVCGSLNGAGAVIGLFVKDKIHQKAMIEDIFSWYEKTTLPIFSPPDSDQQMVTSISNSILCHASTANWANKSGKKLDSKERKERCTRLAGDVAQKTVSILNNYVDGTYTSSSAINDHTAECVQCHSEKGKLANMKGKMNCSSCHNTSIAHTLFADLHYKLLD